MRRITIVATELRRLVPGGGMGAAKTALAVVVTPMGHSLEGGARLAAGNATASPRDDRRSGGAGRVGAAVASLTLLAAAIRLSTLGRQSYWYDELATVSVLHRSFAEMLRAVPHSEATPYLYYLLAWPWTRVFGLGETGLRSLSAVVGTLTVPIAYAAGAALASRRVGVIAAALVAVNPFLVWYSQEARAYSLLVLAAAVTLLFFARALAGDRRSLVWWAVTAGIAIATHYFAVFVVAAEAGILTWRQGPRAFLAAAFPAAVLLAEVPLIMKQRQNGGNLSAAPLSHRIAGIPKDLLVGYSFPAELAGSAAAAVLLLVGVGLALRSRERGAFAAGAVAAIAIVLPILVAAGGADYVIARNTVAVTVPAAIFVGAGYASHRLGLAAGGLLWGLSLVIVVSVAADTRYGRTDWRGAAKALGEAGTTRAIVATPTIDASLLQPYLPDLREPERQASLVREVDVVALASQGGFSATAVHPPTGPPRPAPPGFALASVKRTPTFVLVRYRSPRARRVATANLAALDLSSIPPTILLQGPPSGASR